MARIRTIKPETPQSESFGRLSRDARLCFILLWTVCDDAGRARASSRLLASLLYPYDDGEDCRPRTTGADVERWLCEIEAEGSIQRYEVDGDQYIQVSNWLKHQKIDKPSASRLPECSPTYKESSRKVSKPRETSPTDLGPGPVPGKDQEDGKVACATLPPEAEDDYDATPIILAQGEDAEAVKAYNAAGEPFGWAKCNKLTAARRARVKARLRDCGGLDGWRSAMERAKSSPFLRGETGRTSGHENWKVTIDFFLAESSFVKLMEGAYGGAADSSHERPPPGVDPVEWFAKRQGQSP